MTGHHEQQEDSQLDTRKLSTFFAAIMVLAGCGQSQENPPGETVNAPPSASPDSPPALQRPASTSDARVYFITPDDGATVPSPVTVEFGSQAMAVVPAGDTTPDSGHHHVLIDTGLPDLNLPIPKDERHVHFGDGSSATELELPPGEHTLQLLFGDFLHIPHEPPVISERITITVE